MVAGIKGPKESHSFKLFTYEHSEKAQRALVVLKPDGIRYFREATTNLSMSLSQRGVNFHIYSPTLTSVPTSLADELYTEPGERFDIHRKYMSARHPDKRVISAPIIAMVIEAESRPGFDLIRALRSDEIIGPTNPERALETADEETAEQIKQSVRYKLTLGGKSRLWPFPKTEGSPMYNRIHCSDSRESGEREIGIMFLNPSSHPGQVNVPLLDIFGDKDGANILFDLFSPLNYRHFGKRECVRLAHEANEVMPMLLELQGHFFANLDQPVLKEFDYGRFANKPISGAYIIAICGDSGSGKTSLVRVMIEYGYKEMVLHTDREKREGESERSDYFFLSREAMLDAVAQGEFVGVDRVGKNLYGLHTFWTHPSHLSGFKGILAAGPNTIAGLRASLPREVQLATVFIDCSASTLKKRIIARSKDAGANMEARLRRVEGTKNRYAPILPEFDLVVNNDREGEFVKALDQVLALARKLESGGINQIREAPPTYKMTPERRIVQRIFEFNVLEGLKNLRDSRPTGNIDDLEKAAKRALGPSFTLFLSELTKLETGRPYLTQAEENNVAVITQHLLNMVAADLQAFQSEKDVSLIPRRLGRLWHFGNPQIALETFKRIVALRSQITDAEVDFLIAAHDLGKTFQWFNHPEHSCRMVLENKLVEFLEQLTPAQKAMDILVVKYHQNLADCVYSFISWKSGIIEMFADPELRQILTNPDQSINADRLKEFIARIKYWPVIDTAGSRSPSGGLRKLNAKLYFDTADKIEETMLLNSGNYNTALEALEVFGQQAARNYLSTMPFCFDPEADLRAEGFDYYWRLIEKSKNVAIAQGKFSEEDWQSFLSDFSNIDSKYSPMLWWVYFTEKPTDMTLNPGIIPPTGVWHFYVLMDKLGRKLIPGFPHKKKMQLCFFDKHGREVAEKDREMASAWEMHKLFQDVAGYKAEGNHAYFIDSHGAKLDGLSIEIIAGNTGYTFKVTHTNLVLPK